MLNYVEAHKFSSNNRVQLITAKKCGCFFCLKIFAPMEIESWLTGDPGTALCPYCGVDAVIGEHSGYRITEEFLREMQQYWFA